MALSDEPSMAELGRMLQALKEQIADAITKMREDRTHAEATFVRRDVYESDRRATAIRDVEAQKDLDELQRHREADANWRRQIMLAVAVLAITSLVTIAIAVSNYMAR